MLVNSNFIFRNRRIGLVLILLIFFSALFFPILCQNKKLAVIPNISSEGNNDRNWVELLTTIENSNERLELIILLGDLGVKSDQTKINELVEYISEQNIPFKIIPGFEDYSYEINSTDIIENQLTEKDFVLNSSGINFIGFNSVIPFNDKNGFINVETLQEIETGLNFSPSKISLLFSNRSPEKIINIDQLLNNLGTEKAIYFYPASKEFNIESNKKNNLLAVSLPSLKTSDNSFYYLLELAADSLFINKKSYNDSTSKILYSEALNKFDKLKLTKSKTVIDSSLIILRDIDYKSTSSNELLISKNRIYTILENGLVYCLDSTGKEIFVTEIFGKLKSDALLYKDILLIPTNQGDLYSVNSNNGEIIQVVGIGENISTNLTLVNVDERTIGTVLGTINGNIFCYDAFTFELLWKNKFTDKPIVSTISPTEDKIIFLTSDLSVYCINTKSGILIWKYQQKGKNEFLSKNIQQSDGKNIFTLTPEGEIICLDLLQGKKIWSSDIKLDLNQLYLNHKEESLYCLNSSGRFYVISTKDGKTKTNIELKKSGIFSYRLLENENKILLALSDGSLNMITESKELNFLISPSNVPVTALHLISENKIVIKDLNGKITILKIRE